MSLTLKISKRSVVSAFALFLVSAAAQADIQTKCDIYNLTIGKDGQLIRLSAQDGTYTGKLIGTESNNQVLVYSYADEDSADIRIFADRSLIETGNGSLEMIYPGQAPQMLDCKVEE
jgi:hypothetical protein